ncbi:MAG: hypothetical protein R2827_11905 [Bdellovibrionales bacterium]
MVTPFSGTTSSASLAMKEVCLFAHDFQISAENTDWRQELPKQNNGYVLTQYRSPEILSGVQPALTVRVDNFRGKYLLKAVYEKIFKPIHDLDFKS